jgi:hypothetical protein
LEAANLLWSDDFHCNLLPPERKMNGMLRHEQRNQVLAKLTNARCEIEDALNISSPVARYDPVIVTKLARDKLSAVIDKLNRVLREIEGSQ